VFSLVGLPALCSIPDVADWGQLEDESGGILWGEKDLLFYPWIDEAVLASAFLKMIFFPDYFFIILATGYCWIPTIPPLSEDLGTVVVVAVDETGLALLFRSSWYFPWSLPTWGRGTIAPPDFIDETFFFSSSAPLSGLEKESSEYSPQF
jgi:hypothetical protein